MNIKPIKTEKDYEVALELIDSLLDAGVEPDTPEGDRFEVLSILIEAYERENYPIPLPDPIEAIQYYLESRGLSNADLEQFIGSRARVWEILNRRRSLSLNMIRRLSAGLGIPPEVLIQPYELSDSLIEQEIQKTLVSGVLEFSEEFWKPGDMRQATFYFQKILNETTRIYKINADFHELIEKPIDLNIAETVHEKATL